MKKSLAQGLCLVALSFFSVDALADEPAPAAPAAKERSAVDAALKRDSAQVDLTAKSSASDTALPARGGGGPIEGKATGLGAAGVGTKAQTNAGAGSASDLGAPQLAEPTMRPSARTRGRRGAAKAEDPQRAALEAMNGTFASCLTSADANVEGAAVMNAAITPSGDVTSVTTVTPGGVSPKAASCFRDALTHAKFAAGAAPSIVQVRLVPRDLRAAAAPQATAVAQK